MKQNMTNATDPHCLSSCCEHILSRVRRRARISPSATVSNRSRPSRDEWDMRAAAASPTGLLTGNASYRRNKTETRQKDEKQAIFCIANVLETSSPQVIKCNTWLLNDDVVGNVAGNNIKENVCTWGRMMWAVETRQWFTKDRYTVARVFNLLSHCNRTQFKWLIVFRCARTGRRQDAIIIVLIWQCLLRASCSAHPSMRLSM